MLTRETARVAGIEPEMASPQPNPVGLAILLATGIAPGAAHDAPQDRVPAIATGHVALFGPDPFLARDEGLNAPAGPTARPADHLWQEHAHGLSAHVDGMLHIDLVREVPEALKPRRIEIARSVAGDANLVEAQAVN